MAISGIGSQINVLQAIRAQNAFAKKPAEKIESLQPIEKEFAVEPKITSKIAFDKNDKNIMAVKNFAEKYNRTDVDEEDINYALRYGTSLFADYTA